jgi:hypothetical protein
MFLVLVLVFVIHAGVFLRQFLCNKRQFYFLVTCLGFILLTSFYGYLVYAQYSHTSTYSDWTRYLRFSGIALCAVSLPILAKRLYFWFKSRFAHQSQT